MKIRYEGLEEKVNIREVKKVAPCGACGVEVDRDQMWAMNTLFASPRDQKTRIRVRLCDECAENLMGDTRQMEWDNSQMKVLK